MVRYSDVIGRNIIRLRKAQGLTQAAVATRAALAQNYISEMERGQDVNPTLETLNRVAAALETDLPALLQLGEPVGPPTSRRVARHSTQAPSQILSGPGSR